MLTRREWLVSSGLGAAALVPSLVPSLAGRWSTGWSEELLALEARATAARRRAGPVRLCFNENPFGMSPKAKAAITTAWDEHNKYDPPSLGALREEFARHVGVRPEQVLVTQGSGELLDLAALAYGLHGGELVAATPTFEGIIDYAKAIGAPVHRVPLTDTLQHDLDAMDRRTTGAVKLVFVCNPNNPTGTLTDNAKLRDFVGSVSRRAVVLVDEAYHDFVDDSSYSSLIDMVQRGENIIVSRTASKIHGLAGLRVGFAIARPDIIEKLGRFATGTPNVFGMAAVTASLRDTEYQGFVRARNAEGRALLTSTLKAMGRRVAPSQTNFVFFHAGMPVERVGKAARERGYLIGRPFPPYTDWVRVSVGTPEEMNGFVKVLPELLRA